MVGWSALDQANAVFLGAGTGGKDPGGGGGLGSALSSGGEMGRLLLLVVSSWL
jgi:hypothetical protein